MLQEMKDKIYEVKTKRWDFYLQFAWVENDMLSKVRMENFEIWIMKKSKYERNGMPNKARQKIQRN